MLYGNLYDEIVVREELIYAIQDGCYVIYDYDGAEVFEKKYKKEKSQSKKSQKISYIFCSYIFFAYLCPIYSKIF